VVPAVKQGDFVDTLTSTDLDELPEAAINVALPRFGECSYTESDVVRFPWGLPGFPLLRRFLVISIDETDGYIWLQSLDDPTIAIPMCDPWSVYEEYEAPLPLYAKQSLEIERAESFCVMCVLVARDGETTINLLAPIIINLDTRTGRQVTLENQKYSVRTPIRRRPDGSKEVIPD